MKIATYVDRQFNLPRLSVEGIYAGEKRAGRITVIPSEPAAKVGFVQPEAG